MNRVVPLSEVENFESIAFDLRDLLKNKDNKDIAEEFPGLTRRHTGGIDEVIANLEEAKERYIAGIREQFIVLSGERAVGLSIVTNEVNPPEAVEPTCPNVSGLICRPFRGRGLGRLSLEARMEVVQRNFGNRAWTLVRDGNIPSERLVTSAGFRKVDQLVNKGSGYNVYLFGTKQSLNE